MDLGNFRDVPLYFRNFHFMAKLANCRKHGLELSHILNKNWGWVSRRLQSEFLCVFEQRKFNSRIHFISISTGQRFIYAHISICTSSSKNARWKGKYTHVQIKYDANIIKNVLIRVQAFNVQ